jgi:hypothetical protein
MRVFAPICVQTTVPLLLRDPLSYRSTWYGKLATTELDGFTYTSSELFIEPTLMVHSVAISLFSQTLRLIPVVEEARASAMKKDTISTLFILSPPGK